MGGEFCGRNDTRKQDVNIREIYFHWLSSNGIVIFISINQRTEDIWVTDVIIENQII